MRMGVIESGDSGKVVVTQETSGTESDDPADNGFNTSVFIETNPLLPDEREQGHVDLQNSSAASPGVGCMSCKGKCTPHKVKLYMVSKLKAGLTKLKKAGTVLRDRRVSLSITLYVMLSFSVIVGQEVSIQPFQLDACIYPPILLLNACLYSQLPAVNYLYNSYFHC